MFYWQTGVKKGWKLSADFIDFLYICSSHSHTDIETRKKTTLLMWWKKRKEKSGDANRDGGPCSNRIGQRTRRKLRLDLARAGRRVPRPVHCFGVQCKWLWCNTHHTGQEYHASVSLWDHKSCACVCISTLTLDSKPVASARKNEGNEDLHCPGRDCQAV